MIPRRHPGDIYKKIISIQKENDKRDEVDILRFLYSPFRVEVINHCNHCNQCNLIKSQCISYCSKLLKSNFSVGINKYEQSHKVNHITKLES